MDTVTDADVDADTDPSTVQTTMQACVNRRQSLMDKRMHTVSGMGMVADTDMDTGTRRATHSMMFQCFPALSASISRRAPDQV